VQLFVSNALSGTVTRVDLDVPAGGTPVVESETKIASGYAHMTGPNGLIVGPAGLAFDARRDVLYVASTGDNEIFAVPDAARTHTSHGKGQVVINDSAHLHGPVGLLLAPDGGLIVSNGDAVNPDPNHPNELVEFNREGEFIGQFQLDSGAGGAASGIALTVVNGEVRFAAVDGNTNTLDLWTFVTAARRHRDGDGDDNGDD
jgi:sugar lactone lactonase YvrE